MPRDPERDLAERMLEIRKLFARYPNAKLDMPELTLEVYVTQTAYLPIGELRAAIEAAVRASPRFVPSAGELLDAYVNDGIAEIAAGYGPLSRENVQNDARHRRRVHLRELRERHMDRLLLGGSDTPKQLDGGSR